MLTTEISIGRKVMTTRMLNGIPAKTTGTIIPLRDGYPYNQAVAIQWDNPTDFNERSYIAYDDIVDLELIPF